MARIVIAGFPDCPRFALVEYLAEKLESQLSHFEVRKEITDREQWQEYAEKLCQSRGWFTASRQCPIVWREPCGFGGKRLLIGGAAEFQEYAAGYYGQLADVPSSELMRLARHNVEQRKKNFELEKEFKAQQQKPRTVVRICYTGANSPYCYCSLPQFINGYVFDDMTDVIISLVDRPERTERTRGIAMELEDCACPSLIQVNVCDNIVDAFRDANLIVILDDEERGFSESKEMWFARLWQKYTEFGETIDAVASDDCLTLVSVLLENEFGCQYVSYPICNAITNPIKRRNVVLVFALFEAHLKTELAATIGCQSSDIVNAFYMGYKQDPKQLIFEIRSCGISNCEKSSVMGPSNWKRSVDEMNVPDNIANSKALMRWESVMTALCHSPSMSGSAVAVNVIRDWWYSSDNVHTIGVQSEGWFGVPEGLMFFFPVKFTEPKKWKALRNLKLSSRNTLKLNDLIEDATRERQEIHDMVHAGLNLPRLHKNTFRRFLERRQRQREKQLIKQKMHNQMDAKNYTQLNADNEQTDNVNEMYTEMLSAAYKTCIS